MIRLAVNVNGRFAAGSVIREDELDSSFLAQLLATGYAHRVLGEDDGPTGFTAAVAAYRISMLAAVAALREVAALVQGLPADQGLAALEQFNVVNNEAVDAHVRVLDVLVPDLHRLAALHTQSGAQGSPAGAAGETGSSTPVSEGVAGDGPAAPDLSPPPVVDPTPVADPAPPVAPAPASPKSRKAAQPKS